MLASVETHQVSLLLLRDGTIISLFQEGGGEGIRSPIEERLRLSSAIIRDSADPSLLLHNLLDGLVDEILEVIEGYTADVAEIEDRVIRGSDNIDMNLIKELHLIIGELAALKRTIVPLRTVITSLRSQRSDAWEPISDLTRVFLSDVLDHVQIATDTVDALERQLASLIDLTFNFLSYRTNESMRILAVVSILFLPITFLSSVFGMNFEGGFERSETTREAVEPSLRGERSFSRETSHRLLIAHPLIRLRLKRLLIF
jgi:Mg2+ and Co2+ transporter CorA